MASLTTGLTVPIDTSSIPPNARFTTVTTTLASASASMAASSGAAGASTTSPPPKKAPDLTTARNMMIAFACILLLCMFVQLAQFVTRFFASFRDGKKHANQTRDDLPPLSAINSATFLTDRARLRTRRNVGGGGLFSGWILRRGEQGSCVALEKDRFGCSTPAPLDTPNPFSASSASLISAVHLVPPRHTAPMLSHLPLSRWLHSTPFASLPKPFRSTVQIPAILVVILYFAVCMVAVLWKADNAPPLPGKPDGPDYRRTGTIAMVNIPIAVALGVRGNIVGLCLGKGYERLKTFHKIAGRVCFLFATIHIAYFAAKWTWTGKILENSAKPKYMWGWTGWAALLLLAVSSLPWIRKRWFTLFEACHAVGIIMFIIGAAMHVPVLHPWCVAAGGVYVLSMVMTLAKTRIVRAEILALPSSASTVITMPSIRAGWRAGQHVRIRIPALGMRLGYEGHPFTISSAPNSEGLVLMCKNNGDWTNALHKLAQRPSTEGQEGETSSNDVTVIVEGPHGGLGNTLLPSFSSVVLIAGGSGITHSLGLAHDLISRAPSGVVRARTVDLVWIVRTEDIVRPLLPTLLDMVNDAMRFEAACFADHTFLGAQPTALRIHIYVTRSSVSTFTLDQASTPKAKRFESSADVSTYGKQASDSEFELRQVVHKAEGPWAPEPAPLSAGPFSPYGPRYDRPLSCLSAHPERPDFDSIVTTVLHDTVEHHARNRTDASGISVTACGPIGMVNAVNSAVRKVDAGQRQVVGGIEFQEECFGY